MSKGKKIAIAVLSVFMGLFLFLSAFGGALLLADAVCELSARVLPSYERVDIGGIAAKEEWTEEDLHTLSMQTGLSVSGVKSVEKTQLEAFQDSLFSAREVRHEAVSYFSSYDYLIDPSTGVRVRAPLVPLQTGDVIVSTSSHTVGMRHGHSALITAPESGQVLQCISVGMSSDVYGGGTGWFCEASNFMVLRLKDVSEEQRASIAEKAANELVGIPYSLTVGILSAKDQCAGGAKPKETHCSHLVWQAFKNAGYDIDSNGGGLCLTTDIIASPLFEIVQVYGFDPAVYLQ